MASNEARIVVCRPAHSAPDDPARLRAERDELARRVARLELALETIASETEVALTRPETTFHVNRRIATVAEQALRVRDVPEPSSSRVTTAGPRVSNARRGIW
jgi:hypothetical protein